jgi:hypothetical protein
MSKIVIDFETDDMNSAHVSLGSFSVPLLRCRPIRPARVSQVRFPAAQKRIVDPRGDAPDGVEVAATPIFPPSGPAQRPFQGLPLESKFPTPKKYTNNYP